ncbi:MAG: hypothetical protein AAF830_00795 [Pseudomonadota bacterium]
MPLSLEPHDTTTESAELTTSDLVLPRRLDSKYAPELVRQLTDVRGSTLIVDAREVELIGMQCAIALASAVKTWCADDKKLEILGLSETGALDLRNLGLPLEDALSS